MKKQSLQKFNEKFFGDKNITWFIDKGVIQLNANTNATIVMDRNGRAEDYYGYSINIINKEHGVIDSTKFEFNKYFTQENRIDTEKDEECGFRIYDETNDWYIAIPAKKEINAMVNAINQYINLWK